MENELHIEGFDCLVEAHCQVVADIFAQGVAVALVQLGPDFVDDRGHLLAGFGGGDLDQFAVGFLGDQLALDEIVDEARDGRGGQLHVQAQFFEGHARIVDDNHEQVGLGRGQSGGCELFFGHAVHCPAQGLGGEEEAVVHVIASVAHGISPFLFAHTNNDGWEGWQGGM